MSLRSAVVVKSTKNDSSDECESRAYKFDFANLRVVIGELPSDD